MKRTRILVGLAICACLLATAALAQKSQALPEVKIQRTEGWVTIQFPLLQQKSFELPDKTTGIAMEFGGQFDGKPLGLFALLGTAWEEEKSPDIPFSFWWSELAFERSGSPSDNLLEVLASVYKVKSVPKRAKENVQFQVVSIANKPDKSRKEWKLKMFFRGEKPEEYAEAYFNIDFAGKTITLAEKDPEYRNALVKALGSTK